MKHALFSQPDTRPLTLSDLRLAEARLVVMLRHWRFSDNGQEHVAGSLCTILGEVRARACLRGFEDALGLLHRHGWRPLTLRQPGSTLVSEDETAFARFILLATEQDRDVAWLEGSFLVRPDGILPLILAASCVGLPLLCEESRCRLHAALRPA